MKHYSFVQESLNKVLSRSEKLSDSASRKYIDNWIHSRMNQSSLDDSKLEYARRIFLSSINKIKNTAKRNNRQFHLIPTKDINLPAIKIGGNFESMRKRPIGSKLDRAIHHGDDIVVVSVPNNADSTKSLITSYFPNAHESDEYEIVLKLAKKYNLTPSQVVLLLKKKYNTGHAPGVIKKELERNSRLKRLFGVDLSKTNPRTKQEIQNDKIRFNPDEIKKTFNDSERLDFKNDGMFSNPRDLARFIIDAKRNGLL